MSTIYKHGFAVVKCGVCGYSSRIDISKKIECPRCEGTMNLMLQSVSPDVDKSKKINAGNI